MINNTSEYFDGKVVNNQVEHFKLSDLENSIELIEKVSSNLEPMMPHFIIKGKDNIINSYKQGITNIGEVFDDHGITTSGPMQKNYEYLFPNQYEVDSLNKKKSDYHCFMPKSTGESERKKGCCDQVSKKDSKCDSTYANCYCYKKSNLIKDNNNIIHPDKYHGDNLQHNSLCLKPSKLESNDDIKNLPEDYKKPCAHHSVWDSDEKVYDPNLEEYVYKIRDNYAKCHCFNPENLHIK